MIKSTRSSLRSAHSFGSYTDLPKQISSSELLTFSTGTLGESLPLIGVPATQGVDLTDWISQEHDWLRATLSRYGAILFRGFGIDSEERFSDFTEAAALKRLEYIEGATPRTRIGNGIYTSTEFPATETIALHNELTYVRNWPTRIVFCCTVPAQTGGQTPIADVRNVLKRLDPELLEPFRRNGWMLVRNFGEGIGPTWQSSFHAADRSGVEQYCSQNQIECEWGTGDRLRTRQVRRAIITHPQTHEEVWFNHVAFWHISSLKASLRSVLLAEFGEANLPYNTYYGDGSPISSDTAAQIRDAYSAETVAFPWQAGDVLFLDNMLVAHGRSPYEGQRRVVVAMGDGIGSFGSSEV